jgi:hypothetical protein
MVLREIEVCARAGCSPPLKGPDMKTPFLLLATVPLALFATACASSNTGFNTGERISQRGDDIGAYGAAWADGNKDVKEGEQLIRKSDSKLADAQSDLERARDQVARAERRIAEAASSQAVGQQLISSGAQQMQQAEADYSDIRAGPPAVVPEG